MLEVHIQNFSYGKKEILNQIDLELPSSQIIGLVAPNGVGKSTLIQILSGHLRNNGISVCYQGKDYTSEPLFMRQHIVKMPDQSELYDELNGIEHLKFYASMWKVASGTVKNGRLYSSKSGRIFTRDAATPLFCIGASYKSRLHACG